MTDTILIRLNKLTDEERRTVLEISRRAYTRGVQPERKPADPRALEAQHFKTDRGDL
jgi:hypothetical protein